MKFIKTLSTLALISSTVTMASATLAGENNSGRNSPGAPVVFVESQQLYYDSIVVTNLPLAGDFQQLVPGINGLSTAYGPGDVGYLGGRWWIDKDANGVMDESDMYFLCPLLGPGRDLM